MKLKNACFALAILSCVSVAQAQVTGSGTKNDIPVWTGTTTLGNSVISQSAGNVGIGTKKPDAKLDVVTTSTTAPAITGSANATSGTAAGFLGSTASSASGATAVIGMASATTGITFGVQGFSSSDAGIGVQGVTAGGGSGVIGNATAKTGLNFGVQGTTSSSSGVGVQGSSPNVAVAGFNQVCSPTCNLVAGTAGQFVTGSEDLSSRGL